VVGRSGDGTRDCESHETRCKWPSVESKSVGRLVGECGVRPGEVVEFVRRVFVDARLVWNAKWTRVVTVFFGDRVRVVGDERPCVVDG
jgi:hypothetical protein